MKKLERALWIMLLLAMSVSAIPVSALAEDPGARDTVVIEGGPLFVGRSVPLRYRISNDENITAIVNGMIVRSVDSGFIKLDSIIWINRMADPSILTFRADPGIRTNGLNPDSVMIGAVLFGPGANTLPPGNTDIALVYFTGLKVGKVKIDSSYFPGNAAFQLLPSCCDLFTPEFVGGIFDIEARDEPPTILSSYQPIHGVIGSSIEISLEIGSTGHGGLSISSALVSLVDDMTVLSISQPVTTIAEAIEVGWTPGPSDVGVWRYTVVVCDSAGSCDTATAEFDVVLSEDHLVDFAVKEHDVDFRWTGLLHGDLDNDGSSEIIATGFSGGGTPRLGIFKYQASTGFSLVQEEDDRFQNVAPVIGFVDGDDDLDVVTFGPQRNSHLGGDIFARFFEGSLGATLSLRDESLPHPAPPLDAKLAELTGDGKLDVVAVSGIVVSIISLDTNNVLTLFSEFELPDTAKSVNVADFDGDGDADLAIGAVSSLLIYLNDGQGNFSPGAAYAQSYSATDIEVTNRSGDFNGDGILDLCVSTPSVGGLASELIIYTGDGVGGFTAEIARTIIGQVIGNTVGDFNGDTNLDVAYINTTNREVGLLLGDGHGRFESELRYPIAELPPSRIDCLDIDRDGDLDIIVGSSQATVGGSLYVLENALNPDGVRSVNLTISGSDNVALSLCAPDGAMLNCVKNTLPGSEYYLKDVNHDGAIDEFLNLNVAQRGTYIVNAKSNPSHSVGAPFSLEMNTRGVKRRLAKDMPMTAKGFSFEIFPDGASPYYPENGAFIKEAIPLFIVARSAGFDFEIASDISFSAPLNAASVDGDKYTLPISLAGSDTTLYYWHYRTDVGEPWSGPIAVNVLAIASPFCGDVDGSRKVNIADIVYGISKMFAGGPPPIDRAGGDVDNSGVFDISDAIYMIGYLFAGGPSPVCP